MKKEILKYLGIGFGALIILAFAIYFTFAGSGGKKTPKPSKGEEMAEVAEEDIITVDEMPEVGDEVEVKDVVIEDDSITYDSYSFYDDVTSSNYQIYVFHNNLGFDIDIYVDIDFTKGDEVHRNSIYVNNFAAKSDTCIWTMAEEYDSVDVSFSAKRVEKNMCTITDGLDLKLNDNGNGIVATVTNNSGYDAYYVDACVLFTYNGEIVRFQPVSLYSQRDFIPHGESEEFSVDAYGHEYNDVKIYFSGYGAL